MQIAKTSNIKFKKHIQYKNVTLGAANKDNKYIAVRLKNVSTKRQLDE